jgi:small subunit ribosomal protein S9
MKLCRKFSVHVTVNGSGKSSQAKAIAHGISRALEKYEPTLRKELKNKQFLQRDPRVVERKKPGRHKARRGFQWVKR